MNIFIAGGSGAIGRQLVPMLVTAGHRVIAMTRSADSASMLGKMGASPVIGDVFDRRRLFKLVSRSQPEVIIHQLTAYGASQSDPLAQTIRIRTEGTGNLVDAALRSSVRRFVAQSSSFMCKPVAQGLTDEDSPLYLDAPDGVRPLVHAVAALEHQTLSITGMTGIVLRYGWLYGPGTNFDPADAIPRAIKRGRMPLAGEGNGAYSFVHIRDAAFATLRALVCSDGGIYNIVDDEPARLRDWLPVAAQLLDAPPPVSMENSVARAKLGDMLMYILDEQSGASNLKARESLQWRPVITSWKDGFRSLYGKH